MARDTPSALYCEVPEKRLGQLSLGCVEEKVLGGVGVGGVSLGCVEEKVLG